MPVPRYRTGIFWADYQAAIASVLTLYGGVALGIPVLWLCNERRAPSGKRVFQAGFAGAMVATVLVIAAQTLYRWLTTGRAFSAGTSFGLVPVFIIFAVVLGALVAAGAGLIGYALRRAGLPAAPRGPVRG